MEVINLRSAEDFCQLAKINSKSNCQHSVESWNKDGFFPEWMNQRKKEEPYYQWLPR